MENDAYNRLLDAVIIPRIEGKLQEEGRADFIGGLRIEGEDVAALVKGILPPPELRNQVEEAIDGAVFYLDKQEGPVSGEVIEVPDVYIRFGSILGDRTGTGVQPAQGTAKRAIFAFLRSELRTNVEVLPPVRGTTQERITTVAEQLEEALTSLRDPQFPIQIPALGAVPDEFRDQVYDDAVALLPAAGTPPLVLERLAEAEVEIKGQLLLPDPDEALIEALSIAVEAMVEPLIDASFDRLRDNELDEEDRFDPIDRLAQNRGETKAEVLDRLDLARDWLERAKTMGSWVALLVIALASVLMGSIHLPRAGSFIGWPGLTLLLAGAVFLGMAAVLRSQLPNRLESFVEGRGAGCTSVAGAESSFSPEFCSLAVDVTRSMASEVAGGFIVPSAIILIVGLALVVASMLVGRGASSGPNFR